MQGGNNNEAMLLSGKFIGVIVGDAGSWMMNPLEGKIEASS